MPSGPITTAASGFAAPSVAGSAVFAAGAAFAAVLAAAFLAGAALAAAAFLAGAALAAFAVVVFFVVVAAATRAPAGRATEMPRPARCVISALRSRPSTAASSVARRTSSGVTLPEGCACAMRAVMAGWASTPAGTVLRAFEDTNTSRSRDFGARQGPLSSRAASSFCHAPGEAPNRAHPARAPGDQAGSAAAFAATLAAFL